MAVGPLEAVLAQGSAASARLRALHAETLIQSRRRTPLSKPSLPIRSSATKEQASQPSSLSSLTILTLTNLSVLLPASSWGRRAIRGPNPKAILADGALDAVVANNFAASARLGALLALVPQEAVLANASAASASLPALLANGPLGAVLANG